MKTILFLHGLESEPGGVKPTFLSGEGHQVLNPALPRDDFKESVKIAQAHVYACRPDFIVGSSRGGAVAMCLDTLHIPTVLIAPAWKKYGVSPPDMGENATILHSVCDELIPLTDSAELSSDYGYRMHACGADHRMSDPDALKMLKAVVDENR